MTDGSEENALVDCALCGDELGDSDVCVWRGEPCHDKCCVQATIDSLSNSEFAQAVNAIRDETRNVPDAEFYAAHCDTLDSYETEVQNLFDILRKTFLK